MSEAPKVGLDGYSLTGPTGREICERDVFVMLRKVKELGGDGLQASVPDDPGELGEAFDLAAELGLYLEPYAQLPVHWRGDAEVIERRRAKLRVLCEACAERGIHAMHCSVGARERFEDLERWKRFVAVTADCVGELAPMLRDHGVRLGVENHWDFTTYEIIEIAERAGRDVVGVGLDTGNLPILAEAPDRGVERSAPYAVTLQLKDVYLFTAPRGAARPVVPSGQGQIGLAEAVRKLRQQNPSLNFTVEDHSVIYNVDYFEPSWLEAVPELSAYDVATTARLASEGDRWLREHLVPDPHAAELVPWSIRGPDRLKADILAVRKMLADA